MSAFMIALASNVKVFVGSLVAAAVMAGASWGILGQSIVEDGISLGGGVIASSGLLAGAWIIVRGMNILVGRSNEAADHSLLRATQAEDRLAGVEDMIAHWQERALKAEAKIEARESL